MTDRPSARLLDQRIRNRIIEQLDLLTKGEGAVRDAGVGDYMEGFFDWVRDEDMPTHNSAMTEVERNALTEVSTMMKRASDETPWPVSEEELIESGWPKRISPVAKCAIDVFLSRGHFSEDREEDQPSPI